MSFVKLIIVSDMKSGSHMTSSGSALHYSNFFFNKTFLIVLFTINKRNK